MPRIPIFGADLNLGAGVYQEPSSVTDTSDLHSTLPLMFSTDAAKLSVHGSFLVPADYDNAGTTRIVPQYSTVATSGDVEFDFEYTSVAPGETTDPASDDEALNANSTVPGTARLLKEEPMAMTAGNLAAGDRVYFSFSRDGTDAGDTCSGVVRVPDVYFEYDSA